MIDWFYHKLYFDNFLWNAFIAGFQPGSNRQWNGTNLALLKPYSSPLREVKAAGNFWPRRLFPFESYWKVDLLKKEMEPGNSSSVKTGLLTQCGKSLLRPWKSQKVLLSLSECRKDKPQLFRNYIEKKRWVSSTKMYIFCHCL